MIKYSLNVILLIFSSLVFAETDRTILVRYPASDSNPHYYKRVRYYVEILDLALKKSGRPYRLEKISLPFMNESRSKQNLIHNIYDVHWMNAQEFLEPELIPVRIPLCKGLTGWRIFFINPEDQRKFSEVTDIDSLRKNIAGHGHDWPEVPIFNSNNLQQKLSSSWKSLFKMLAKKRIDYLSRSVLEIYDEENAFPELHLSIESNLIVHYPAAYYFYVEKNNRALAELIEKGLKKAVSDGSFDAIFNRYFLNKITRADIPHRRLLEIPFPSSTRFIEDSEPQYWYKPD
jgi:Bacterial extracellular solute-binding proteins, family 3